MLPIPSSGQIALAMQHPAGRNGKRHVEHIWLDVAEVSGCTQAFEDAIELCGRANARGSDIYFTTGSFSGELEAYKGRKSAQVVGQRSLFLDIDCAKWGIDARTTGFDGVLGWLEADPRVLVPSLVVCSGGGLHVYWLCDQDIPLDRWHAAADRLRNGAGEVFFQAIDKQCTIDRARVLRVPGFVNHKYSPPAPVEMLWPTEGQDQPLYTIEELEAMVAEWPRTAAALASATSLSLLEAIGLKVSGAMPKTASAFAGAAQSKPASWSRMAEAARNGKGCRVLAAAMEDNAGVEYDTWCGLLTVVDCTDNVEAGILAISADHPDWDDTWNVDAAVAKAATFGGPRRCASFNSPLCEGCRHRGSITSPVEIGRAHVRLAQATVEVVAPVAAAPGAAPVEKVFTLPEPPHGYTYKHDGKIGTFRHYRKSNDDGTYEDEIDRLWPTPLYLCDDLARDGRGMSAGHITWVGARPHERVPFDHALLLPSELATMVSKLESAGCHHTLNGPPTLVLNMLTPFLASLTRGIGVVSADVIDNFGPATITDRASFSLGGTRYNADGTTNRVVLSNKLPAGSEVGAGMVPSIPPDAERIRAEWIAHLAAVHQGEDRATDRMLMAMGFGSVLPQYIESIARRGLLVLLTSDEGASGKTSSLRSMLSIFARNPLALTVGKATGGGPLARQHAACGVPVLLDDFWQNDKPDEVAQKVKSMALGVTGGGIRAKANGDNAGFVTTWTFMTGNKDVVAAIASSDQAAEGALRRIFAIRYRTAKSSLALDDKFTDFLNWTGDNGGVIGHLWVQHVITHQEELRARHTYWREQLRRVCPAAQEVKYEFVTAAAISTLVGCEAAGALGLHPYDTFEVLNTLAVYIGRSWATMRDHVLQDEDILEALLIRAKSNTITANAARGVNFNTDSMPSGGALISVRRYPDTGMVAISHSGLKALCLKAQISETRAIEDIQARGGTTRRIDLGAGTGLAGLWQPCWFVKLATDVTVEQPENEAGA